jgi:hypothetical protein
MIEESRAVLAGEVVHMKTTLAIVACLFWFSSCGVDRLQHAEFADAGEALSRDGGAASDAGAAADAGSTPFDAGAPVDAGVDGGLDAGIDGGLDAGLSIADAGHDAGTDAGSAFDAGVDAGTLEADAGTVCTVSGISPQLAAVPGGPYQNCQGGVIPRTDVQLNTQPWSGCCGELVRVCAVTGFSTQNVLYCR